jgi:hypothetical protein
MATPNRYDARLPKVFKVKVSGVDRHGNPFSQTANTINVSRTGARLEGIGCVDGAQTIEVKRGWFHKARFRVVWAGMPGTVESAQVGIRCIEPVANFWGLSFPPPSVNTWRPPAEAAAAPAVVFPPSTTGTIPMNWEGYGDGRGRSAGPREEHGVVNASDVFASAPRATAGAKRVEMHVSLSICWQRAGMRQEESALATRVLGNRSCTVALRAQLLEGTPVEVVHGVSREMRPGTVVMSGPAGPDGTRPVTIDLDRPDAEFWTLDSRTYS